MMDQVCEYMVKSVREIDSEAFVLDAAAKLSSLGIGSLLVKKGDDYVEMNTEQEVTRQLVVKNLGP
jgi:predicted transcriptional regulator